MSPNIERSLRSYIVSRFRSVGREKREGEGMDGERERERKKRSAEQQQLVPHL